MTVIQFFHAQESVLISKITPVHPSSKLPHFKCHFPSTLKGGGPHSGLLSRKFLIHSCMSSWPFKVSSSYTQTPGPHSGYSLPKAFLLSYPFLFMEITSHWKVLNGWPWSPSGNECSATPRPRACAEGNFTLVAITTDALIIHTDVSPLFNNILNH